MSISAGQGLFVNPVENVAHAKMGAQLNGPRRCVNTELPGPRRSVKGTD